MLAELSLVATKEYYFSKLTVRTAAVTLADKVIVTKNMLGTPKTCQHETHFYGVTKALYFLFGSEKCFLAYSWTGKYDTENEKKYASIQETFVGNTLKCKN